ncbi:MAG: CSLREA domain-containing protein [Caldilineaceae bacterium]
MCKRIPNHFPLIRSILSVVCLLLVTAPLAVSAQDGSTVYLPVVLTPNIIYVTTTDDELNADGDCSLREALQAVNLGVGIDACPAGQALNIIELPPGIYTLTLTGANEDNNATGDLDILTDVTINGGGATSTLIDGNHSDRVLQIHPDATVVLNNLTIRNGKAPNGADTAAGGGDAQAGQNGGGIANAGALNINASFIIGNSAGNGGTANGEPNQASQGGAGGKGGGIYSEGLLQIRDSQITGNSAGHGGEGGCRGQATPNGGAGGGLFSSSTAMIVNSTIQGNHSGKGGSHSCPPGNEGKLGGEGGGIANLGDMTVDNSTITGNQTGAGHDAKTNGHGGQGGPGGGLYNKGSLVLNNSTVTSNQTGAGGSATPLGLGGKGGNGGGINNQATLTLNNSPVSNNHTGGGGDGAKGGDGGDGGGVANYKNFAPNNSTITGNSTGGGGTSRFGPGGSHGSGGDLYNN